MIQLRAKGHPEADGRKPLYGDVAWTVTVPLEGGETLVLQLGKSDRDMLFGMMIADCSDSGEDEPA
jgi:hypothetical protein